MDNIICPHCGKKVELSEAIIHQLSKKVREEERQKQKIELEKAIAEEKAASEKRLREQFEKENKDTQKALLNAKETQRLLEEKLEKEQKLQEEREEKIRLEAQKEATESSRLDKKEYENKLSDMQKALEDAQRKAKQGSQQLQGEVLELDLEEKLKQAFPNDDFVPVPKGVEGADIWQKVRYKEKIIGSILWETKRTKAWSNSWVTKLKDDMGKIAASEAIIVSQVLPDNTGNFDRKDGVWITFYEHAISIARYVRFLITTVATIKSSTSQTDEEWGKIRDYMLSDSFKHRMQAHFDGVKALRENLDQEKRNTTLRWKRQEVLIERLDSNTLNFYGELKAIASDLPEIEEVDVAFLEESNETQETLI
ncbi:MAG: DUF2130 domain-containing protein [Candidatus Levybacteria bacterium]|nr:DUF2130 domain-containing protein [Candidatus Levybacteria bacterium]